MDNLGRDENMETFFTGGDENTSLQMCFDAVIFTGGAAGANWHRMVIQSSPNHLPLLLPPPPPTVVVLLKNFHHLFNTLRIVTLIFCPCSFSFKFNCLISTG